MMKNVRFVKKVLVMVVLFFAVQVTTGLVTEKMVAHAAVPVVGSKGGKSSSRSTTESGSSSSVKTKDGVTEVTYKNTTSADQDVANQANESMSKAIFNQSGGQVGISCEPQGLKITSDTWGSLSREDQKTALEQLAGSNYYKSIESEDRSAIVSALESCSGTKDGTVLMTILFGNTKPDWSGAYKILEPFNGPLGKILGVGALLCSMCLVLVMLADIFYMTIPWVRVKKENAGDTRWVSAAAINAIEKCESGGEDGKGQVLWEYLKHRAVMLFLFGMCILYLISGKIFNIIGWFMDLASGTL